MKIAVIGAGLSGLVSAYVLAKAGVDVVLYEKEHYLGGHDRTVYRRASGTVQYFWNKDYGN
ncbi:hypothetical protein BVC80_281g5 [Macleaya cordata]|uniref:Amine oxidase n=1 Tax=Macleaya cordata TaxID=56857 RepID=A0A200QS53_MACCD|nr:hypothetical protein BVC80_281g5 [Macleaya cordata]